MLDSVSWGEFLKLLGLVFTCYYGYVVIRYFRADIFGFLAKGKNLGMQGKDGRNATSSGRYSLDDLLRLLEQIDAELLANSGNSAELILLLRRIISRSGLPMSNRVKKNIVGHLLLLVKAEQLDLKEEDLLKLFGEFPT